MKHLARTPILIAAFLLLITGPLTAAGLDPQTATPYDLQVVLHISKHRQLTDFFVDRIEGKMGDSLQAALGEMARVKVVRQHPLLEEVVKKGLDHGLDNINLKTPGKIHFVFIDYANNQYEIRARQIDGLTGHVTPLVRLTRTRDRDFVAAAAARLVSQDFGVVGTLQLPSKNREVRVDLKGSGLGSIAPLVRQGDVFQLFQINQISGKEQARPMRYTLLQVTKPPGEGGQGCTCRIYRPVDSELDTAGILGYRCIRLSTGSFPVKLRLLEKNDKGLGLVEGIVGVTVRRRGFDGEEGTLLNGRADQGVFDTVQKGKDGLFDNVAFASLDLGGGRVARVPLALVADREEEVVISRTPNQENDRFRFQFDRWVDGVRLTYLVENNLFTQIKNLVEKKERFQAMQEARDGLAQIRKDLKELTNQRASLQMEIEKMSAAQKPRMAPYDDQIRKIEEGEKDLTSFLGELEKIDKEENDPKRREQLAEEKQAQLYEKDLELGKAIDIYKKLIAAGFDEKRLTEKIRQLQVIWSPEGAKPEFTKGRQFVFDEWTKNLDSETLAISIAEARKALAAFKAAHDLLGPRKLLEGTVSHAVRLKAQLDKLNPADTEEEKTIEEINKVSSDLGKLAEEAEKVIAEEVAKKK